MCIKYISKAVGKYARHVGISGKWYIIMNFLFSVLTLNILFSLQDDLKESDRVLLDIFKQLENNVSELNDSISVWRVSGQSPGRPTSFTGLDFGTSRSSYCEDSPHGGFNGLETILDDTSKEDIYKASTESDSLYLPEHGSSSNSCSPVLPPLKSHPSIHSLASGGSSSAKRSADPSPSPQLRTSTSFTSRLANSPSITRLQDETGSNISRNSSIDSGIQFASEAENGSANEVEPMQVPEVESEVPTAVPAAESEVRAAESKVRAAESEVEANDVRKSVGFADDIFAVLGMK